MPNTCPKLCHFYIFVMLVFNDVCITVSLCECGPMSVCAQKRSEDCFGYPETTVLSCLMWILGTELGSPVGPLSALNW